jgi:hypothetical protein
VDESARGGILLPLVIPYYGCQFDSSSAPVATSATLAPVAIAPTASPPTTSGTVSPIAPEGTPLPSFTESSPTATVHQQPRVHQIQPSLRTLPYRLAQNPPQRKSTNNLGYNQSYRPCRHTFPHRYSAPRFCIEQINAVCQDISYPSCLYNHLPFAFRHLRLTSLSSTCSTMLTSIVPDFQFLRDT